MHRLSVKSLLALLFRILLSAAFFITALFKVHPIEFFEFTLVESGLIGWGPAAYLARGLIGLEFAFSALLLLGTNGRPVLKAVLVFLVLMSLYLVVLLLQKGNVADCGCLGGHGSITPLTSLLKNGGMITLVLGTLYLGGGPGIPFYQGIISISFILIALGAPFFIEPLEFGKKEADTLEDYPIEKLKGLKELKGKDLELDSGKKILAFMSTNCHWCKLATRKMGIMDERSEEKLPVHFFLYGKEASEERFWKEARVGPYPSTRLPLEKVIKFSKGMVPALILVENGKATTRLGFNDITEERIKDHLQE